MTGVPEVGDVVQSEGKKYVVCTGIGVSGGFIVRDISESLPYLIEKDKTWWDRAELVKPQNTWWGGRKEIHPDKDAAGRLSLGLVRGKFLNGRVVWKLHHAIPNSVGEVMSLFEFMKTTSRIGRVDKIYLSTTGMGKLSNAFGFSIDADESIMGADVVLDESLGSDTIRLESWDDRERFKEMQGELAVTLKALEQSAKVIKKIVGKYEESMQDAVKTVRASREYVHKCNDLNTSCECIQCQTARQSDEFLKNYGWMV